MAFEFELPDVGEGIAEGELVSWLVDVGDAVAEDQPLAEVETDKAMVDVPSPVDGTVTEKLYEEGDIVPVGGVFVIIERDGEVENAELREAGESETAEAETGATDAGAEPASAAAGPAGDGTEAAAQDAPVPEGRVFAAPSARRLARELGVDIAEVEGTGPAGRVTEQDVRARAESGGTAEESGPAETAEQAEAGEPAGEPVDAAEPAAVESADRERSLAAPATRRVAEELDVDLDAVPAAERRDSEAFVDEAAVREYARVQQEAQARQAERVREEGAAAGAEAGEEAAGERVERIEYGGVRQTIGDAMVESKFTAPHVTHHDTAVVDDLVETRERLKPEAEAQDVRLTYMPFVMKAAVAALKRHPVLNAELDEEAGEILRKKYYNVGVATATDAGLMVPVVEDVDGKGLLQISTEVNELVEKARERSIAPDELQGSTFSVTNFGAIGGEYATPILNYPEVGILGIGELKQRPVVEDGEVVARYTLPISLTIDHRIVDGADAAQFANAFIEYVENPELLLLE
ncbi:MAG: 2-oxo acid dehydrogenase subunit E2 [Halobacteriales archaeon]